MKFWKWDFCLLFGRSETQRLLVTVFKSNANVSKCNVSHTDLWETDKTGSHNWQCYWVLFCLNSMPLNQILHPRNGIRFVIIWYFTLKKLLKIQVITRIVRGISVHAPITKSHLFYKMLGTQQAAILLLYSHPHINISYFRFWS